MHRGGAADRNLNDGRCNRAALATWHLSDLARSLVREMRLGRSSRKGAHKCTHDCQHRKPGESEVQGARRAAFC